MSIVDKLKNLFVKESQARIVTSMSQVGRAVETPANYENFSRKGYNKNVVVFTSVNKVTTACKGINWTLYSKKGKNLTEISEHPLLKLWERPNPMQSTSDFIESCIGFYLLSGNMYIEQNKPLKEVKELWPVRPDKMKIIPAANGYPAFYEFTFNGQSRKWPVDQVKLTSDIIHMKSFNPTNDWYGLSPIEAAMLSLDQNNAGQRWNLALLQNSATPSGVLQMKVTDANPRGEITNEQYGRLKNEFDEYQTGAKNAGRPLIIEGGLNWQSISLGPKDMDYINNKEVTATDICLVFGVPPEIIGLGDKTFNNYKEARLAFYEETILPLMDSFKNNINRSLTPIYGENLYLDYDKDDIEALVEKREAKYTSLAAVNFLTQNEKRESVGYDKEDGLDVYVIGNELLTAEDIKNYNLDTETPPVDEVEDDETDNTTQNKPPQESTSVENDDETEDETGAGKSINLITQKEKRQAYKRINRKRNFFTNVFRNDVKEDYQDLIKDFVSTADKMKNAEPRLIEYALLKDLTDFEPKLRRTLRKNISLVAREFSNEIFGDAKNQGIVLEVKANVKYEQFIEAYIEQRSGTQIKTILNTNAKQIKRIVSEWTAQSIRDGSTIDELSKFLQMEFEQLTDSNAQRIARTEVALASQNGSLEAAKSLGISNLTKEWVSASDDRVRDGDKGGPDHAAMNGVVIDVDEKFNVPPDILMDGPGDNAAPADQVINCRCVLVYKVNNKE